MGYITEALELLLYSFAVPAEVQQALVPGGRGPLRHGSDLCAGGAVSQLHAARRSRVPQRTRTAARHARAGGSPCQLHPGILS